MNRARLQRLFGELAVIVLGVLVALGVDDWRSAQADRELEDVLLIRLASELVADSTDLALAERTVSRRLWVVDALLAELGDSGAADRLTDARLERLVAVTPFDPVRAPLAPFRSLPEFDLSDDAYQEMLATGALSVVRDPAVRASILEYYRRAEDQGGNEKRAAEYQMGLEEALSWADITFADSMDFSELVQRARSDPRLPTELRRAVGRIRLQLRYYSNIEGARVRLETVIGTYDDRR